MDLFAVIDLSWEQTVIVALAGLLVIAGMNLRWRIGDLIEQFKGDLLEVRDRLRDVLPAEFVEVLEGPLKDDYTSVASKVKSLIKLVRDPERLEFMVARWFYTQLKKRLEIPEEEEKIVKIVFPPEPPPAQPAPPPKVAA